MKRIHVKKADTISQGKLYALKVIAYKEKMLQEPMLYFRPNSGVRGTV
jgi:hypothetical protein